MQSADRHRVCLLWVSPRTVVSKAIYQTIAGRESGTPYTGREGSLTPAFLVSTALGGGFNGVNESSWSKYRDSSNYYARLCIAEAPDRVRAMTVEDKIDDFHGMRQIYCCVAIASKSDWQATGISS